MIDGTDTTYDTEIGAMQDYAYQYINAVLDPYTTVPLTSVPDIIKNVENDLAACYWRDNQAEVTNTTDEKPSIFCTRAKAALQLYIDTTYIDTDGQSSPSFAITESGDIS